MLTHYLHKKIVDTWEKFKHFISRINYPILYKASFIAGYILVCILILIPTLDYEEWYPGLVSKIDYNLSTDFKEHKAVNIQIKKGSLEKSLQIINDRFSNLGVKENHREINGNTLSFHYPTELSDDLVSTALSVGKIEIKKQKDDFQNDFSAATLYEPDNYESSGIDIDKISNARIIEQKDGYTLIEISTTQEKEWNNLTDTVQTTYLGLFIDDQITLAQAVPTGNEVPKPRMVIFSDDQKTLLIPSLLTNEKLDTVSTFVIREEEQIRKIDFTKAITISIFLSLTFGLVYRYFFLKDSNRSIATSMLIVTGLLTVSKVIPITWGLLEIILLSIISLSILITKRNQILTIGIFLSILGILVNQITDNNYYNASILVYVTGFCSIVLYLVFFFTGISDEKL